MRFKEIESGRAESRLRDYRYDDQELGFVSMKVAVSDVSEQGKAQQTEKRQGNVEKGKKDGG